LLKFIEQQAVRLGYYKIVLSCDTSNLRAVRAFRHAGYRDVGVFRNHGYNKGRLVDIMYMERLLTVDLDRLKNYYSQTYPFYADYFEEEELLAQQELYLDDFEEVPIENPEALPEGIVRFLKRKPDRPSARVRASGEVRRRREEERRAAEQRARREAEEAARKAALEQVEREKAQAAKETAEEPAAAPQTAVQSSKVESEQQAVPVQEQADEKKNDQPERRKTPAKPKQPRKTVQPEEHRVKSARRRKKAEEDMNIPMEGQLSLGDIIDSN
jgi:hypothetical protein